ncbi:MAG: YcxB family protein [Ezakiella sp.]|nr:YcxB family protein [Ezakiella sp.]
MKLEVNPVIEDYIKFARVALFEQKQVRRSIAFQSAALPILAMLITLLGRPINWTNVFFAACLSVLWIVFYPKIFKKMLGKRVENSVKDMANKNEHFLDPFIIEQVEGGLKAVRNGEEYNLLYDDIEMYNEDEEHLFLIGGGFDFIIPRRAFNSDEEFNRMKDQIDFAIQVELKRN